jgi:hypothetical protein
MKTGETDWSGELETNAELLNKPTLWLQWPLAALAYIRGDLKQGRLFVLKTQDPTQLKLVDQLKVVAHRSGFNPGATRLKTDPTGEVDLKVKATELTFNTDSKQITWRGNIGLVSIESARFQAVIGFLGNRKLNNLAWTVETPNFFGSICSVSLVDSPLSSSNHILVAATTRMENTGMIYNQAKTKLMDKGKAPLLVEPLNAKITLKRLRKDPQLMVRALDANGKQLSEKVPVKWSGNNLTLTWIAPAFYMEVYR